MQNIYYISTWLFAKGRYYKMAPGTGVRSESRTFDMQSGIPVPLKPVYSPAFLFKQSFRYSGGKF